MPVDLRHQFSEAIDNLLKWRNRYGGEEYPFKIVQNTFYQQYALDSMWDAINESFGSKLGTHETVKQAHDELERKFSLSASKWTVGDKLVNKMEERRDVGGINYSDSERLIRGARSGDNDKLEEIEFTYVHYFLVNKTILIWAALGRSGSNITDAIGRVTGAIVNINGSLDYAGASQFFGQFAVAPYLHEHYKALPPVF